MDRNVKQFYGCYRLVCPLQAVQTETSSMNTAPPLTPDPRSLARGAGCKRIAARPTLPFLQRMPRALLPPTVTPPTPHTVTHRRLKDKPERRPIFSAVLVLIIVQMGSTLGPIHRLETEAQLKKHCRLLMRVLQRATPPPHRGHLGGDPGTQHVGQLRGQERPERGPTLLGQACTRDDQLWTTAACPGLGH